MRLEAVGSGEGTTAMRFSAGVRSFPAVCSTVRLQMMTGCKRFSTTRFITPEWRKWKSNFNGDQCTLTLLNLLSSVRYVHLLVWFFSSVCPNVLLQIAKGSKELHASIGFTVESGSIMQSFVCMKPVQCVECFFASVVSAFKRFYFGVDSNVNLEAV